LLERPCTFQGLQNAARDETIDRLDEPPASGLVGKQVDPALFESVLDIAEVNALIFMFQHDGLYQPFHDVVRDYMHEFI
ncbi:MAG: hypothetical protein WC141_10805, partial [Arcobacteraceae bacterium]